MIKIKELRLGQEWSRFTLAVRAGVTEQYIYLVETGKCNPSLNKLEKIANCFGLHAKDLL